MTDKTALGDRMKAYERREAGRRAMPLLPICARIDGKRFSRWTAGLARPYDERLTQLMIAVTCELVESTQARIGYTQSDEISLVYHSTSPAQQLFLDGRIQKLTSILASMTTAAFNRRACAAIPERADQPALFDCRVWTVPNVDEAANVFLWREQDATKNSVSMAARHYYPHEAIEGRDGAALQEMLLTRGVRWSDYPACFKRGTFVQRVVTQRAFRADELAALPEKHAARTHPALLVERAETRALDMPPFGRVKNRVAVIFEGAMPVVGDASS